MPTRFRFDHDRVRAAIYLVIVPAMVVACLILILVNWRNQHAHQAEVAKQQAAAAKVQAAENQRQIKVLRAALGEACRSSATVEELISSLILYFAAQPKSYTTELLTASLAAQGQDAGNLSACARIKRP